MQSSVYLNGGYWASWRQYQGYTPSSTPVDLLTHVHYAFADIYRNGSIGFADQYLNPPAKYDNMTGGIRAWTTVKKQNPQLKLSLAIGGAGQSVAQNFAAVAGDKDLLSTFTKSVKDFLQNFGWDGVDIDWEYPNNAVDAQNFLNMLVALRTRLGPQALITTALPAGQWALKWLDLARVAVVVDFINLMAYDFVGPSSTATYQAQLYSTSSSGNNSDSGGAAAIDYMIQRGVPPRKIMLGVPLYGYGFKVAHKAREVGSGSGNSTGANKVVYEVRDLPRPESSEVFDKTAIATYAIDGDVFITYDNKDSVGKKAEYVKQKGLRGLFYWHLTADRTGSASLVRGGYEVLMGSLATQANPLVDSLIG